MGLTRRQLIVTGAAAGVLGAGASMCRYASRQQAFLWRGVALGGEASIILYSGDRELAADALAAVTAEIDRLENIYSLQRESSELSRLNAAGWLAYPSRDLLELVLGTVDWRTRTHGAFDPTVQPIWQALASGSEIGLDVLSRAGTAIEANPHAIRLQPGSSLTLNGIAQGRIADRVSEVLVGFGFTDVVVDTGELRLPGKVKRHVEVPAAGLQLKLAGASVATSEPGSLIFDARSGRNHLIDPKTGESPQYWKSVTVIAPTAEMADALSTAFAVLPREAIGDLASSFHETSVIATAKYGQVLQLGRPELVALRGGTS